VSGGVPQSHLQNQQSFISIFSYIYLQGNWVKNEDFSRTGAPSSAFLGDGVPQTEEHIFEILST
jgi:hypothetical protein